MKMYRGKPVWTEIFAEREVPLNPLLSRTRENSSDLYKVWNNEYTV